jgi:hypothetical protein
MSEGKPLGRKSYGSIGHLPGSRMGSGDHSCPEGYHRICCEKVRDKFDRVYVQEKLDGSCVSVALLDGVILPLGRAGWPAESSPYLQHRHFANWVRCNEDRFRSVLRDGERIVGEWLAQAHGTIYELQHEPFVAFDIMRDSVRLPLESFNERISGRFVVPALIATEPTSIDSAMDALLEFGFHGAQDLVEGVVWRVERHVTGKEKRVDFLAKYVRPDKVDGFYLPEISGGEAVWNWSPK